MNYHKINHQGSKILETERLILRPFTLDDAGTMFRNWASDPEVTKFLTWPTHASREVSEKVLRDWVEQYEKPDLSVGHRAQGAGGARWQYCRGRSGPKGGEGHGGVLHWTGVVASGDHQRGYGAGD